MTHSFRYFRRDSDQTHQVCIEVFQRFGSVGSADQLFGLSAAVGYIQPGTFQMNSQNLGSISFPITERVTSMASVMSA